MVASACRRSLRWLVSLFALAAVLGCGGGTLPERANPERARQALRTALDTWQKGESTEALANGSPPLKSNAVPLVVGGAEKFSYSSFQCVKYSASNRMSASRICPV